MSNYKDPILMTQNSDPSPNISPVSAGQNLLVPAVLGAAALIALAAMSGAPMILGGSVLATYLTGLLLYATFQKHRHNKSIASDPAAEDASIFRLTVDLVDSLPEAVAIIDQNNHVVHANANAQALVNIDPLGRPLSAYIPNKKVDKRLSRALAGHKAEPLMVHIEAPSEQRLRLSFSQARSFGQAGGGLASGQSLTLVIFNDVTDIVIEQDRRADFLANASHELKTPIASLMGYIETLRGHAKDDPEAREKFLEIMHAQAERMQRLINDLLSLRQIELTEHVAPTEVADLHLAIKAAIQVVAPLCKKRGVTIDYKTVKKNNALVRGKQDECVQLFLNLIENAAKISSPGFTVHVQLRRMEQWSSVRAFEDGHLPDTAPNRRILNASPSPLPGWLTTISDSGPGFAREHLPRVGERFYRIAGDLSSQEKGTGLGLAIVKHIVLRHRGGLYIRSEAGQGTDISVLLMADETAGKAKGPELV